MSNSDNTFTYNILVPDFLLFAVSAAAAFAILLEICRHL